MCYNSDEPRGIREDCHKLHAAVREYLKQQGGRGGRGRGRGRGRGCGGPTITEVSVRDLQSMVNSLPGEKTSPSFFRRIGYLTVEPR